MPVYDDLKLIFIHIPKTGGTSVENYLENKLKIETETQSQSIFHTLEADPRVNHSLQHCTYQELEWLLPKDSFATYTFFTILRNPFHRTLSDLFFNKLVKPVFDKQNISHEEKYDAILQALRKYLNVNDTFDNHKTPQVDYLLDSDGNLPTRIKILRTESLNKNMKDIMGFKDFNTHANTNNLSVDYDKFYYGELKELIHKKYSRDYELLEKLIR